MARILQPFGYVVLFLVAYGGCKPIELHSDLTRQVNDAIAAIDDFNRVAERTPNNLRLAADQVIDKLNFEGKEMLAHDARSFTDHTLGVAGIVPKGVIAYGDEKMKAYFDALKRALETALTKIKAEKSRDKVLELLRNINVDIKPLEPFVESANPNRIKLLFLHDHIGRSKGVEYKSPRVLEYFGHGLLRPDSELTHYRMVAIGQTEADVREIAATVSPAGPFNATVNLGGFTPAESDREIRLYWGEKKLAHIALETEVVKDSPPSLPEPSAIAARPADISGVLLDNGDGKVSFVIQHIDNPEQGTIVIRRANKSMWWKKLVVKNDGGDITSVETKDHDDGNEISLVAGSLQGNLKLAFGKAGFLSCWKGVHEIPFTKEELLGKRIIYTWERD